MHYRIRHQTVYEYETTASVSHNVLYLHPLETATQQVHRHRITIHPAPKSRAKRRDALGNRYEVIAVEIPHRTLKIVSDSEVTVSAPLEVDADATPPWEAVQAMARTPTNLAALEASAFSFESPLVPYWDPLGEFARSCFRSNVPVLRGARDLMSLVYREFIYDPTSTTVTTAVPAVFEQRRGVCQDFAHVMLSALRTIGLPGRYVSGYLETLPPPGKPRLIGVDASHAWVSVFTGEATGWVDLDPTNNLCPSTRHVTLATGRDYQDVTPVRGVVLGGGAHTLTVSVDVTPETD